MVPLVGDALVASLVCFVVAVSDGDTMTARCGELGAYEQFKVRINAIDAPERSQSFGQVSRQHLVRLCFRQQAVITPKTNDRYGRTVADVQCRGQDVATEQVRLGLAWYYVQFGAGYEGLGEREAQARADRLGLWSAEAVAPWVWRRTLRR